MEAKRRVPVIKRDRHLSSDATPVVHRRDDCGAHRPVRRGPDELERKASDRLLYSAGIIERADDQLDAPCFLVPTSQTRRVFVYSSSV